MRHPFAAAVCAAGCCGAFFGTAGAQGLDALAGAWFAEMQAPGGLVVLVRMQVEGAGGTWQQTPRGVALQPNACMGKPHPMTITQLPSGAFKIHILASQTLKGCQDGQATVTLVDGKKLEGNFGDGRPLRLAR